MKMQVQRPSVQQTKPSVQADQKQLLPTSTQSLNMVTNVLLTSIGSLGFLRGIFPEDHFRDVMSKPNNSNSNGKGSTKQDKNQNGTTASTSGINLKTISRNASRESDALLDWIEIGCMDAIRRRYLRFLIVDICHELPQVGSDSSKSSDSDSNVDNLVGDVLESYIFEFSYPDDGNWSVAIISGDAGHTAVVNTAASGKIPSDESLDEEFKRKMVTQTKFDILKSTSSLLRSLLAMTFTLDPLPDKVMLSMRMKYYEGVVPTTYNPPLFRDMESNEKNDSRYTGLRDNVHISAIGKVGSANHMVLMGIQTRATTFSQKSNKEEAEEVNNHTSVKKTKKVGSKNSKRSRTKVKSAIKESTPTPTSTSTTSTIANHNKKSKVRQGKVSLGDKANDAAVAPQVNSPKTYISSPDLAVPDASTQDHNPVTHSDKPSRSSSSKPNPTNEKTATKGRKRFKKVSRKRKVGEGVSLQTSMTGASVASRTRSSRKDNHHN